MESVVRKLIEVYRYIPRVLDVVANHWLGCAFADRHVCDRDPKFRELFAYVSDGIGDICRRNVSEATLHIASIINHEGLARPGPSFLA